MPTLRQLECFVAVADEGSFTRAASSLRLSQPGLSAQIASFEREIGSPLLERRLEGSYLTPLGRLALPHARAALTAAARVRNVAKDSRELRGTVTVATVYSVSLGQLPPLLRRWRKELPEVEITLREHRHSHEMRAAMLRGEADLAIGPRPASWSGTVVPLAEEQFVVLLSDDEGTQRLDDDTRVSLSSLADHRWIHYSPAHGLSEVLESACRASGFVPDAAVRVEQTASAVAFAGAGLGPALVPQSIVPDGFRGRVYFPSPAITRELVIYARDLNDALLRRLAELATGPRELARGH
ncbi:LysR family transcriptional regulator [Humibacter sp. BT305]|nr:LysR family transcriptional regulator [Humibacter sp. BT305]